MQNCPFGQVTRHFFSANFTLSDWYVVSSSKEERHEANYPFSHSVRIASCFSDCHGIVYKDCNKRWFYASPDLFGEGCRGCCCNVMEVVYRGLVRHCNRRYSRLKIGFIIMIMT